MKQFSLAEKYRINLILLWMTTLGQASIALYLPSLPAISHDLGLSPIVIKQTITLFIIGFGLSPLFYGPLMDRYGRKLILIISLTIACLGYILNIFAYTLDLFATARLLQGLGCGGPLIGARAIIRDVFSGRELASATSYLSMGFAIGFGVSPTIGGYLSHYFGWRANFIFLLVAGLAILLGVIFLLPESVAAKEQKIHLPTFIYKTLIAYKLILSNWRFIQYLLAGVFAYGIVVAYNVMTPFLMQNRFMLTSTQYGYLAILMGIPYYCAASSNRKLVLKLGIKPVCTLGSGLIILAGGTMLLLAFMGKLHFIYIVITLMIATFGQALIFSNTISGALQEFPAHISGKVGAMLSGGQMLIVSILSSIMALLPNGRSLPIALIITVLGLLVAGLICNIQNK